MNQCGHLIFVYGTLRSGLRLHSFIEKSRYISDATISGELCDLGHYPALRLIDNGAVLGEVWEVDDHTLSALDQVEGYDSIRKDGLYLRCDVIATCTNSCLMIVQAYLGNMDLSRATRIHTGKVTDYKEWINMFSR